MTNQVEMNASFMVRKEGELIIFNQLIEKKIPISLSMAELSLFRKEVCQLENQIMNIQKTIDDNKLQNDLDKLNKQMINLKSAEKDWDRLAQPEVDKLKEKIKSHIRKEKAKCGFSRITDTTQRVLKINEILAPLCNEYDLDMLNPLILEIKRDFDKI